jgi:hypothetical protein
MFDERLQRRPQNGRGAAIRSSLEKKPTRKGNDMKKNKALRLITAACALSTSVVWAQYDSAAQPAPPVQEPAPAAPAPSPETTDLQAELVTQIRELEARGQDVQTQLQQIAQQAMQANPELQQQQQHLQELYNEKLREYGYPSDERIVELQQMQNQLQQGGEAMTDAERQALTETFQAEVQSMQMAQMQAEQDAEVQQALRAQQSAEETAMTEVDANTPQLQQELERIAAELEELQARMQSLMQQQW